MTTTGVPRGVPLHRLRRTTALRSLALRGDERAFTALYRRHHQELYRYARSILRHDQDAQDALQSTMTKAFAALQEEQRDFEVRPWLFRIAHNEAISLLRRRRPTAELEAAASLGTDGLAEQVEDRRRLAELESDLADLPERQRAALVLRELNGLGHDEIAVVLDSTARSVKQTIFEARTALHECAEGRSMPCEDVRRALSDADGRVLRGRRLRAHLRDCGTCRSFQTAIGQREADLAALVPPLPVAGAAALLAHLLPGSGSAAGVAGAAGAGTAPAATGWLGAGVATKVAVFAAAAVTATGAASTAIHLEQRGGDRTVRHVQPTTDAATRRAAARPAPTSTSTGAPAAARPTSRDRPARPGAAPGRRRAAGGAAQHGSNPSGHGRPAASPRPPGAPGASAGAPHRSGAASGRHAGGGSPHRATTPGGRQAKAPRGVGRTRPPAAARSKSAGASTAKRARRSSSGTPATRPPGSTHAGATAGPDATGAAGAQGGHPSSAGSGQP